MDDTDFSFATFGELKLIGVQIALDDFGTGHSSLACLRRFPINALKFDRSFVGDILNDPSDAEIITTIITMAHNLGHRVIAEGVETQEQLDFLREKQCDEFQGYLFSRPIPAEELETMLRQEGRSPAAAGGRRGHRAVSPSAGSSPHTF
jgi:EAL domain-containing protein (putative c-di-GMP-specific phosphodiesterase class I)